MNSLPRLIPRDVSRDMDGASKPDRPPIVAPVLIVCVVGSVCLALGLRATVPIMGATILLVRFVFSLRLTELLILWLFVGLSIGAYGTYNLGAIPDLSFHRLMTLLLIPDFLREKKASGGRLISNALDLSLVLLASACVLSIAFSTQYVQPGRILLDCLLIPMFFYFAAKWCCRDKVYLERLHPACVVALVIHGAWGIAEILVGYDIMPDPGGQTYRTIPRVNGPMQMAEPYALTVIMLTSVVLSRNSATALLRTLRRIGLVMGVVAVVFSMGRSPWLALFVLLVTHQFFRKPTRTVAVGAVIVALALAVLPIVVPAVEDSNVWKYRVANVSTVQARLSTYRSALLMFLDSPILGVGMGMYTETYNRGVIKYYGEVGGVPGGVTPHNSYLSVLVQAGLVGFSAYLFFFGAALVVLMRVFRNASTERRRDHGLACVAIVAMYMVASVPANQFNDIHILNHLFLFFLGAASGVAPVSERREHRSYRAYVAPNTGRHGTSIGGRDGTGRLHRRWGFDAGVR